MLRKVLVGVWALTLWVAPAMALREIDLINIGHKAIFKATSGSVKFKPDVGLLTMKDPRCPSQSFIRIKTSAQDTMDVELPCQNWTFTGSKYAYSDPVGTTAGVLKIGWKSQKMKIKFKGSGFTPLTGGITFLEARLTVHDKSFCARFNTFTENVDGMIKATSSSACDPLPPTLTPTPTLTRTPTLTLTPSLTPTITLTPTPSLTWTPTATQTPKPVIVITSPAHGVFLPKLTSSVTVTGTVNMNGVTDSAIVTVNGNPVAVTSGTFSTNISVAEFVGGNPNQPLIFNPIVAELHIPTTGFAARDRNVAIIGDSLPDDNCLTNPAACSPQSIGLRITDPGFDTLEPVIVDLVDLDPSTLVVPGTQVLDNYSASGAELDAWINAVDLLGNPGFTLGIDSQTNKAHALITLNGLYVELRIKCEAGAVCFLAGYFTCYPEITPPQTFLNADFGLQRHAVTPTQVDVFQIGATAITFSSLPVQANCDSWLGDIVNGIVEDEISGQIGTQLQNFLDVTDGSGNTPIAGAIEGALAGVEISGPIGMAINVTLQTPFSSQMGVTDGVNEDNNGITLRTDSSVTKPGMLTGVDLSASYYYSQTFPTFGTSTPTLMQPYHLGLCLSSSAFNQILKGMVEGGLLKTDMTDLDLDGAGGNPPTGITAGLLSAFIPEFGFLPPTTPMKIKLSPSMAPLVTNIAGPAGELADMRVSQLEVSLVSCSGPTAMACGTETLQLKAAVDTRIGLGLNFNNMTGGLDFALSAPAVQDIGVVILDNPAGVNESLLVIVLPEVIAPLLPSLSSALGSFPVPSFFGLNSCGVESSRSSGYMCVFLNLTAGACP